MSAAFLTAREAAAPAPVAARTLLSVAATSLLAATLFWLPLLLGGPLGGHDWNTHHFHYFDWTHQAFTVHRSFPLFMADAWVTPNFLANAESPTLGPLVWLLFFLSPGVYLKLLFVSFCAAGLAGGWLLARDLGASPPVAVFAAGTYAFGGFFVSHLAVGHHWAMGAWLLPLFVLLVRRAVLGSDRALVFAGLVNAWTILGGQHQPFVWQNLLLGVVVVLWCVQVRAAYPMWRALGIVGVTVGFGAVKLLPMVFEFGSYAPAARISGLPPLAAIASLFGRGQTAGQADASLDYEFGAGWWEYAFYLGPFAALLLAAGLVAARRVWPLLVVAAVALLMSLEPSPWVLFQDLPLLRSQRCPARFLLIALFAATFAATTGIERLRGLAESRGVPHVALVLWVLVALAVGDLWFESRAWQQGATGRAVASRSHRPVPEDLSADGATAQLRDFSPNALRYVVDAPSPARIVLPLRYGRDRLEWEIGDEAVALERSDVWLAARVTPETKELALRYRPPGFVVGAVVSLVSVVGVSSILFVRRRTT